MTPTGPRTRIAAGLALCLVLALGGQAIADALVPEASGADTTRAVGRATNSYLTGLRTYAAAALWNRIDPLMHSYYVSVPLDDQLYILSTISVVQWLDPQAVRSYSVGAWVLSQNDRTAEALEMAERGVAHNPKSGVALASCAQLQALYGDSQRALELTELAVEEDVVWPEPEETHTWLVLLSEIVKAAGRDDLYDEVQSRLREIDAQVGEGLPAEAHDHDGDGVPDH